MKKFLNRILLIGFWIFLILGTIVGLLSLIPAGNPAEIRQIKSEVDRVLVPVTVTDMSGRLIGGLCQGGSAFRIWEDNIEQEILHCAVEDAPVSVVIIFDNSGSMTTKANVSRAALAEFVKAGNSQDEYCLIVFNEGITQRTQWIKSEDITNALLTAGPEPKGRTALLDAIYLGIATAKTGSYSRKVIIVLTDGGDNHSRYTETDVKHAFKESDVQFYGIGLFDCDPRISLCDFKTHEERMGPELLAELAEMTGGVSYMVAPDNTGIVNGKMLSNLAAFISEAIRDQYYLTYKPLYSKMHDGKYHKIKVKVKEPRGSHLGFLIPYTRNGYRSPAE